MLVTYTRSGMPQAVFVRDDVVLAELLHRPAQHRHTILDGSRGQLLTQPAGDQLLDVLGLQALGTQSSMPQLVQLIGDEVKDVLAVGLGRVAAIAVMPAEFFEVVVQVAHWCLLEGMGEGARAMTFVPARRCRTAARRASAGARTILSFRRMLRFLRMRHSLRQRVVLGARAPFFVAVVTPVR